MAQQDSIFTYNGAMGIVHASTRFMMIFLALVLTAACAGLPGPNTGSGIGTAIGGDACGDSWKVAEAFYGANDAGDFTTSLDLLTDDVALVTWATGANGYHMSPSFAVGKNQVRERLGEPGLRRTAVDAGRPNFLEQDRSSEGNILRFQLMPDRLRENGRPFNHYAVELILNGCKIEIIKVVERVTWL